MVGERLNSGTSRDWGKRIKNRVNFHPVLPYFGIVHNLNIELRAERQL
jgi:hypothetical protein